MRSGIEKLPFISALALAAFAPSAASASTCNDPDVRRVERPYFPKSSSGPDSKSFPFAFRYKPAEPGFPTVIHLPGGPGGTSILDNESPQFTMPHGFGLILTDPRGVGCNEIPGEALPDEFYTTENLAKDVLAVVQSLGLKNYILHGGSYGTMVATVAAGLAEKGAVPRPSAIVLEGVLGRSFAPMEVFSGFVNRWEQLKQSGQISSEILATLNEQAPLGFSHNTWGRAISALTILGADPASKKDLVPGLLALLRPGTPEPAIANLKKLIGNFEKQAPDPQAERIFQAIGCHEISTGIFHAGLDVDFTLENGTLVPVLGHLCDGIPMDRPFDAREWKTSAPIYYFEGEHDPSTPMAQARYNFESQTLADRVFVTVKEGSHPALTYNLSDCRVGIFSAIAQGGQELETALKACALQTETVQASSSSKSSAAAR